MARLLNDKVKQREWFRPFGASVLADPAGEWFAIPRNTLSDRFMLLAHPVRPDKLGLIPAVTHVDGTTRLQVVDRESNPVFYEVIDEFARITGVPLVLNTSLNESEPIVCSPADALRTCLRSGVDFLAIDGRVIDVAKCDAGVAALLDVTAQGSGSAPRERLSAEEAVHARKFAEEPDLAADVEAVFMSR